MPIYEVTCQTEGCSEFGRIKETLLRRWNSALPACPQCGAALSREVSKCFPIWCHPLSHYDKPGCQEGGKDSHVVMRKISSKSGNPEPFVVDSIQKQREICRDECLIPPTELNSNVEIMNDGRDFGYAGVKGQWASPVPDGQPDDPLWLKSPEWN